MSIKVPMAGQWPLDDPPRKSLSIPSDSAPIMTFANMRANGVRTLAAWCLDHCRTSAQNDVARHRPKLGAKFGPDN
jgi:hypothetical protein